ncbi:MAG: hypothetical protein IKF45_02910 [Lachnospiraceae bacterium]|nr:hypothetical protein [Lachnospiraceae bacterium]
MASLLQSTLNTRALPTGSLRYIRSDYPGRLIDDYMETKENLMEFLTAYVREHPEVDINIIIPKEENIRRVLEALDRK